MSDLQRICDQVSAVSGEIADHSRQLLETATRLRSAASYAATVARSAENGSGQINHVASSLNAAAEYCISASQRLQQAQQAGYLFVARTYAGGTGGAGTAMNSLAPATPNPSWSQAQHVTANSMFTTQSGVAFLGPGDSVTTAAQNIQASPDSFVVVVHGSPSSIGVHYGPGDDDWVGLDAAGFADVLAPLLPDSGVIELWSCETGQDPNGFAQQLADRLGRPVRAPDSTLWVADQGYGWVYGTTAKIVDGEVRHVPDERRPGKWITFYPRQVTTEAW